METVQTVREQAEEIAKLYLPNKDQAANRKELVQKIIVIGTGSKGETLAKIQEHLKDAQLVIVSKDEKIQELEGKLATAEADIKELKATVADFDTSELEKQVADLKASAKATEETNASLITQYNEAIKESQELKKDLAELEKVNADLVKTSKEKEKATPAKTTSKKS